MLLFAWLTLADAEASAYYFADVGVRAFGRGGAFIAGADDINAQYYNPAALSRIKGGRFTLNVAAVDQYVYFDRADEVNGGTTEVFDPVLNVAKPFVIPNFGVSWDAGREGTTFAFGFYPPYAPDVSYDPNGPQRYTLVDTAVIQTNLGPSVGHRFVEWAPWLSVGAGVSWALMYAEQELVLTTSGNDDPAGDIRFRLAATDRARFTGNAGILIEPESGRFAIGASVTPPIKFLAEGSMTGDFTTHGLYTGGFVTDPIVQDDAISLAITMPLILRAGVLVRPIDGLEVELAGVWQDWRIVETIVVDDVEMNLHTQAGDVVIEGPIELPAGYEDAFSVRLGAEYDVNDQLALRAGGMFESSAIPGATQGVGLVDGPKWGYSAGATYKVGRRYAIDAGFAQQLIVPREITNSQVTQVQIDAISGEVSDGKVVGNGVFESRVTMFGVGLSVDFDLQDAAPAAAGAAAGG
ncbi:MAG: hypothetical protein RIT28_79 [Pseudomonadota bacterium]